MPSLTNLCSFEIKDPFIQTQLSNDEVHVWRYSLNRSSHEMQKLFNLLSPDEVARASRFRFEKDHNHFIIGRGMLRVILGGYLNNEPSQLHLITGQSGKPMLQVEPDGRSLQFNLSHSNGLALFAVVWDHGIGIDLEQIIPILEAERLAQRFFSNLEYALIRSIREKDRLKAFYTIWVLKEACLKASGEGLYIPLDQIEVSPVAAEIFLSAHDNDEDERRSALEWQLQLFHPAPDYVAAVAVEDRQKPFFIRYLTDGSSINDIGLFNG